MMTDRIQANNRLLYLEGILINILYKPFSYKSRQKLREKLLVLIRLTKLALAPVKLHTFQQKVAS
jgi:hypothetical protein